MCCSDSTRTTEGSAIAILKSECGEPELNLIFHTHNQGTVASLRGHCKVNADLSDMDIRIQYVRQTSPESEAVTDKEPAVTGTFEHQPVRQTFFIVSQCLLQKV